MKEYISIVLISLSFNCFSQGEGNFWHFGYGSGVDFNSGVPVGLTDGKLNHLEGSATISNNNGDLLFYTDGISAWNRNHQKMPNGNSTMSGHSSNTQTMIVKKPLSDSLYYIFNTSPNPNDSFTYSIVDISLDAGLGDIFQLNTILAPTTTEKVTAIKHDNNVDIWILMHTGDAWSNTYHAYLLTANGIDTVPVISNIGSEIGSAIERGIGALKVNRFGNKVASVQHSLAKIDIMDFNQFSGKLSNFYYLHSYWGFNGLTAYSVEFSIDSKLLYVSNGPYLLQFDLTAGSRIDIQNTITIIDTTVRSSVQLGHLQLAPDSKIYVSEPILDYLSVIKNPDVAGVGCNFEHYGVYLMDSLCSYGLPNMPHWYFFDTTSIISPITQSSSSKEDAKLIQIVDILGRETKPHKNVPLYYRYSNGTVEKKVLLD